MTSLKDLDRCTYLAGDCEAILAVGWLGEDDGFPRGDVSPVFFEKLKALCADPWAPFAAAGSHQCELCQYDGPWFSTNLFVPFNGRIYAAPVGIVHYIAAHRYLPPQVFIDAVLACPPMRSMPYHKALLANGGRVLVRGLSN
ncbi:hypothetical protein [Roseateles chitinivorans]|uniref:DUF7919 family protein n=1 Tax=Roseateles chitinivorans TaxID=2917965 RepID=UPI003D673246